VSARTALRYPKLYTPGIQNLLFNRSVFLHSLLEGVMTSLVIFFVPYAALRDGLRHDGMALSDLKLFGNTVANVLVVVVTLRVRGV
jgi:phospholipid-translocating ATPase